MAMKSHPLLSGCLITALVVFFFLGVTVIAYNFLGKDKLLTSSDKVGVVEIKGVIVDGIRRMGDAAGYPSAGWVSGPF